MHQMWPEPSSCAGMPSDGSLPDTALRKNQSRQLPPTPSASPLRKLSRGAIALIDNVPLLRGVPPHASQAIRLQLQTHRQRISHPRILLPQIRDPLLDAQDLLHVMPNLVRHHIRLRELAGRSEAVL